MFKILFSGNAIFGQKTGIKCNAGYGIWESFHAGFDLRLKNYSIGFDAGTSFKTMPFDHKYYSLTIDNTLYLGRVNKFGSKSWYIDSRLIYWKSTEPNTTWNVLQICPSIGKDFSLTETIGFNFDLGPAIMLHANRHDNNDEKVGWIYPVYPELRIEIYYRF